MRSFFKENLALVTGLALPLLLIGFFVVAGSLSRATVPDPRHDLVFTIDYYKNMDNRPWTINLESGKIVIRKRKIARNETAYSEAPRLYVFDHTTLSARKLDVDFSQVDSQGKVSSPALDSINKNAVLEGPLAPDGYRFDYVGYGHGGFLGDVFGMSGPRSAYALVKDTRSIPIKGSEAFYNAEFIGWVGDTAP